VNEFIKYSSIENSYRQAFLDKCALAVGNKTMVALEKIHGANFSWIVSAEGVRVAKRSGLIEETETFYGHTRFYNRYLPAVITLFELAKDENPSLVQLTLYGEIFGGSYNGTTAQSAKKVQTGVNYHPDNEFMAFDIRLTFDTGVSRYLSYADMEELILDANVINSSDIRSHIPIAPIIGVGTLETLIKLDPLFYTKVPMFFGLDQSDEKTNRDYAEGFVIRGFHEDIYVGNERVILKQKNALYGEKEKEVKIKVAVNLSEEQQAKLDKICSYINENRLAAVVSKLGTVTQKDFGRIQGELTRDALEDFAKDEGYKLHEDSEWGPLAKLVGKHSADTIRAQWLNLIDG
jgi:Rnl2 family RNA ligase